MSTPRFSLNLFYSYSHRDSKHRDRMETSLGLLRDTGLKDWSDKCIYPGETINEEIESKMGNSDIFVFLVSPHFLASTPCREEWEYAHQLSKSRPGVVLVPVILAPCGWEDFQDMSDFKALPDDARPVKSFRDQDSAWQEVYNGLKLVIQKLKRVFEVKDDFREDLGRTEFISQDYLGLEDIFVFPSIATHPDSMEDFRRGKTFECVSDIIREKHVIVYGDRLSGKSALCRYIFLDLVAQYKPAIYIDLAMIQKAKPTKFVVATEYYRQFSGDLEAWLEKPDKVVILDNLSDDARVAEHVLNMIDIFEIVIVSSDTHTFQAYYKDDQRFAQLTQVEIRPLTQAKQERLIRNHLKISDTKIHESGKVQVLPDSYVDSMEHRVNSVIISNRILPRYPFYVLSVLQAHETYMPRDFAITSYGHCHYALILAHLLKLGIIRDDDVGVCLNFCENFAFEIHESKAFGSGTGAEHFISFVKKYRHKFIISESILNRLLSTDYGIISNSRGHFRFQLMYYYFLGQYLAHNLGKHRPEIQRIVQRSYTTYNSLVLLFTIHHTNDYALIEDILKHTKAALDYLEPAKLDPPETKAFESMVDEIPHDILSLKSVESERERERDLRDEQELQAEQSDHTDDDIGGAADLTEPMNDVYRITKNNEILGQIVRNKYGSMDRATITDIVSVVIRGGLRLIRFCICDEKELHQLAEFLHSKNPKFDVDKLKSILGLLAFHWTNHNIDRIANTLNKPEITEVVDDVLARYDLPAYDLIGYFLKLNKIETYSDSDRRDLHNLCNKYKDRVIRRLISLRTQHYMNTHRIETSLEQGVCEELDLNYRPRLKGADVIDQESKSVSRKYSYKGKKRNVSRRKKKR